MDKRSTMAPDFAKVELRRGHHYQSAQPTLQDVLREMEVTFNEDDPSGVRILRSHSNMAPAELWIMCLEKERSPMRNWLVRFRSERDDKFVVRTKVNEADFVECILYGCPELIRCECIISPSDQNLIATAIETFLTDGIPSVQLTWLPAELAIDDEFA